MRGLTTRSTGLLAGGAYAPSARSRLAHALSWSVKYFLQSPSSSEQWRTAALECVEIGGLIVRCSGLPAAIENTNPFESQGAHRCLVRASFVALLSIVGSGPEGAGNGGTRPFDKGLP